MTIGSKIIQGTCSGHVCVVCGVGTCMRGVVWRMHAPSGVVHACAEWCGACMRVVVWCMHARSAVVHACA